MTFSKFDSKASNEGLLSVLLFVVAGLSLWVEYHSYVIYRCPRKRQTKH